MWNQSQVRGHVTTATTTVQEITPVEHSDIVCLLEDEFLKKCLREETC